MAGEHLYHDGDQNAERSPGGTGSKCQAAGDKKNSGRQKLLETGRTAVHGVSHELGGTQVSRNTTDAPSKGKNQNRGHHSLKAFRHRIGKLPEREYPAPQKINKGKQDGHEGSQHQAH